MSNVRLAKENKLALPVWVDGLLMMGATHLTSSMFSNYLTLDKTIYTTGMVGGLAITALGLMYWKDPIEKFFEETGNKGIRVINKEKRSYGYDIYLSLPVGMCLSDFSGYKEALEQHLDAEIDFLYEDKKIKAIVKTGKLLDSYKFEVYNTASPTDIVIGHSRTGLETLDLQKAFHILLSGQTGAGKSVCLRTIITTLILTKKPAELVLHLVDFKRVELGIFKNSSMVSDFCKTVEEFDVLLDRLGDESDRRYELFEDKGLVNIQSYNRKYKPLPYHICIIDEFSILEDYDDVLLKLKKRLALDRACGIHYIVCTQRPSHEILPGSLKANIPTKLSFKTSTAKNSEIILDQSGAELLRGSGQGLLKSDTLKKIQTMYLGEEEAKKLIKHTFINKRLLKKDTSGVIAIGDKEGHNPLLTNRKI